MRRSPSAIAIVFVTILLSLIEYYSFQAFKGFIELVHWDKKISYSIYITFSILVLLMFLLFPVLNIEEKPAIVRNTYFLILMSTIISKLIITIFMLLSDIITLITFYISKYVMPNHTSGNTNTITRSKFISTIGLGIGMFMFGSLLYGSSNKYKYKIKRYNPNFDNIPEGLKGLKIVQLSDIHSGSFDNNDAVLKGIELVNSLNPDIVLFTGDLVNNKANEIDKFIPMFRKIKSKFGIYSSLGNHDYGDYASWNSEEEKEKNFEDFIQKHKDLGWDLLRNEHRILNINGSKLAIVGVENWSKSNNFPKKGDLNKACLDLPSDSFNILMSHDPSHWRAQVLERKEISLTLSGHTHGMQMGIEIPGFKWSPSKYMYKEWAGGYVSENQKLYVNRGFGFLGYPGRLGILPEITLITL